MYTEHSRHAFCEYISIPLKLFDRSSTFMKENRTTLIFSLSLVLSLFVN